MDAAERARCPSSECKSGSVLLGVVLPEGRVAFAGERIVIDQEFVDLASAGRAPEKRFRFSGQCVGGACRQWDGQGCGLIDRLLSSFEAEPGPAPVSAELPACSIRSECRWFAQRGGSACAVCPEIVTDATESASELPTHVVAGREIRMARAPASRDVPTGSGSVPGSDPAQT